MAIQVREAGALLQAMSALLTRVFAAGLAYIFQIFLAKNLGIENYGVFVTFWTWQVILTHIAVMGFDESVVKYLPRYLANNKQALGFHFLKHGLKFILLTSVATSALLGAGLVFGGDLLADRMYGSAIVLAIGLPVLALELYVEGVSRSVGRYLLGIIPGYVLRPVLVMALLFGLKALGYPLNAETALAAVIVATLILVSFQALILWKDLIKIPLRTTPKRFKKLQKYWILAALPLVVITGVEELFYWSDVVILGFMVPSEQVSIYFAALRVMAITSFIHYAFMFVFAREFSIANAGGNPQDMQDRVSLASGWTFWLTIPAVLMTFLAGPFLLSLFGEVFLAGQVIMLAIGLGIIGKSFVGPAANLLIVTGHVRQNVSIAAIALLANIALSVVLVLQIGILGAAIGTACSQVLRTVLLAHYCKRSLKVDVMSPLNPLQLIKRKASAP